MLKVIFDMEKMQTKLIIAVIIVAVFSTMYVMIPREEFGTTLGYDDKTPSDMDILEFSVLSQVCTSNPKTYARSLRVRVLAMCQLLLGYGILLI